jgi:hypothetical protein
MYGTENEAMDVPEFGAARKPVTHTDQSHSNVSQKTAGNEKTQRRYETVANRTITHII